MPAQPSREVSTREQIAKVLASYYSELPAPEADKFSITHLLRHLDRPTSGSASYELEVCSAHATRGGSEYSPLRPIVPWRTFARTLGASPGSAGGYMIDAGPRGELALLLQPYSVVAEAGARVLEAPAGTGDFTVPVEKTTASGSWLTPGGSASSGEGTLATVALQPHTWVGLIDYSLQLGAQAGPLADRLISAALLSAMGTAIDAAVITGTGLAQPTGIVHRADITPTSGTTLSFATIVAMRKAVLAAGGRESRLRWLADPATQEVLAKREKAAGSGFIWADGKVADIPAIASPRVPAGYLLLADWSTLSTAFWGGGPQIEVNPSSGFNTGGATARVLAQFDCAFTLPGAVAYASSVT